MRKSSMSLWTLAREFAALLGVKDLCVVRKAAAVKFICRPMIQTSTVIDFDKVLDQQVRAIPHARAHRAAVPQSVSCTLERAV